MLREVTGVKQNREEGVRRWFSDDYFDLIVWYTDSGDIVGLQLCYDIRGDERVLTWHRERGYGHNRVDSGEERPSRNMTPILVADGVFSRDEIARVFEERSEGMDGAVKQLVLEKLRAY